ncbi:rhodanese-like domain-containing protein [Nitrospira sp. MA-1]|nr:rhodanese-like domain-containing protein [Nitrospira sp. MA-1]
MNFLRPPLHDVLPILPKSGDSEFNSSHLDPHSSLIPVDELRDHLQQLDPSQETVVYCRVGLRGYLAARILLQHGFIKVFNLTGGFLSFPQ